MAVTQILSYCATRQAWEPLRYQDAAASALEWGAACVLVGGADRMQLIQASADGNIYEADTGTDDNGVAIAYAATTKKFDMGAVSMLHSVFIRAAAVTDTLSLLVTTGGSEYGDLSRTYTVSLAGTGDKEVKVRLHRTLMGRWVQLAFNGDVSNRPALREVVIRYVPMRQGRLSA